MGLPVLEMTVSEFESLPIYNNLNVSDCAKFPIGKRLRLGAGRSKNGEFIVGEIQDTGNLLANQWATIAPPAIGLNRYQVEFVEEQ